MDETYGTKAIILNRHDFREFDTKVTVFSLTGGKQDLVARGTKKTSSKLAGHLEPVTLSNIMVVRGKNFDYIGSAVNENSFLGIKRNYSKVLVVSEAVKIFLESVKENESDLALFAMLVDFFEALEQAEIESSNYIVWVSLFKIKLLKELGYEPLWDNCVICRRPISGEAKFVLNKCGLACTGCAPAGDLTISQKSLKMLYTVLRGNFSSLLKQNIREIERQEINRLGNDFFKYQFN